MPIEAPPTGTVTPPVEVFRSGFTTTMRLVDPTSGSELFNAGPFTATTLNSLEFGFPTVRASSVAIAGAHGEWDTTRWMGASVATAALTLPEGPAADTAADLLTGLLNPGKRFYLYAQRPGWVAERRAMVRGATFTCPPGVLRQAQAGFQVPSGLLEDAALSQVTLVPTAAGGGGMIFPVTFPMSFDTGLVPGAAVVPVGGNVECAPVVDIFGPCVDPLVRCVDTGAVTSFPGLEIANGDYLRVDMGARSAYMNGDPAQTRYQYFDFAGGSSWWTLPPGTSVQLVFSASAASDPCQAVVAWRSAWIPV